MRRRITLGILALALSATALIGTARRVEAQEICPFCAIGYHCCVNGGNPACFPDSNPCT